MDLRLRINPIEIPELLHLIGCHLAKGEQRICMLVSRTWCQLFRAYYWNHLYFNRYGIPHLEKYGHLVRRLSAYNANEGDLRAMAGYCHFVQQLHLELGRDPVGGALEILMGNLPHLQHLTFQGSTSFKEAEYIAITRQKNLRSLCLGSHGGCPLNLELDLPILLNILEDCPTISSLKLERVYIRDDKRAIYANPQLQTGQPATPAKPATTTLAQPSTAWLRLTARMFPRIPGLMYPSEEGKASEEGKVMKEPWRKFTAPSTATYIASRQKDNLLWRDPSLTQPFPRLTKIHITHVSMVGQARFTLGNLLRRSPHVQDIHIDFTQHSKPSTVDCMEAMARYCHHIQSMTLEGLCLIPATAAAIELLFRQTHQDLVHLGLKRCRLLDIPLSRIPDSTAASLRSIHFDSTLLRPESVHRFILRCGQLRSWTCTSNMIQEPPSLQIENYLEPWPFYDSIRSLHQSNCLGGQEGKAAFFSRVAQMPRLVSLGISIDDIRDSLETPSWDQVESFHQPPNTLVASEKNEKEKEDEATHKGWYFVSIQEIVLDAIRVDFNSHMLQSLQLNAEEVQYILCAFPRLRRIQYQGRTFPLDESGRQWLEQSSRNIPVTHVSHVHHPLY